MDEFLTDRCSIERGTEAVSSSGEVTKTYASHATNIPCSIQPRTTSYRQVEFGRDDAATHFAFFRSNQDVKVGDHVIFGGVRYLVTFVGSYTNLAQHKEADLRRVQAP